MRRAGNGGEALLLGTNHVGPIDLLLTDVVMPEMGGRDLSDRLVQRHPDIKVLFMSGYTDDAVIRHGVLEDEVHFLQKPFSMNDLLSRVRRVLDEAMVVA